MNLSSSGLDILKTLEGFRSKPYEDVAGKLTVGYGHLIVPGDGVASGDIIDQVKATELLHHDVQRTVEGVNSCVTRDINQNQFDALVLFAYNLGVGALRSSTLIKLLGAGDFYGASGQFERWCFAGGKYTTGLLTRRITEKNLFLKAP
jgi:lysozyme